MIENKISTRRYGRLLAVLYMKENNWDTSEDKNLLVYAEKIKDFCPLFNEFEEQTKDKIFSFASTLINLCLKNHEYCIEQINKASFNRRYDQFTSIDKALLFVGMSEFRTETSSSIIIKEILRVSDLLKNEHAAPYISGILKNICYGKKNMMHFAKKPKIRLKSRIEKE